MNSMNEYSPNRRTFLRQAACAALGATALVNTISCLHLTSAALAQGASKDDYKALVCIFLTGGNDANNLLIPAGSAASDPLRADYEYGRGNLAIADVDNGLVIPASTRAFMKHFGTYKPLMAAHPSAPEIATLFNGGELAFVCNVGTLAEPIETRNAYLNGSVLVPDDLFSHSDQRMAWQTSVPTSHSTTGWGGRTADLLHESFNADGSQVSMSISLAGINTFQRSVLDATRPFAVGTDGVKSLIDFGNSHDPYKDAYHEGGSFVNPTYRENRTGARLQALENLVRLSRSNLLAQDYAGKVVNARVLEQTIGAAISAASESGVDFDQHFNSAQTDLGDQLKVVAQLIAGRSELGNRRQIFFVSVDGYDIHKEHLPAHAQLLGELSTALMAFRNVLQAMGDWNNVVTFTASDFNRTFSSNGSDVSAGTDHAWGGHAMVMGGPVHGGNLYGHFPSLKVGDHAESIDAQYGRGRWIPAVAVDQYSAVLARWLGVESSAMDEIFPNLHRFDDPLTSSTPNLAFLST